MPREDFQALVCTTWYVWPRDEVTFPGPGSMREQPGTACYSAAQLIYKCCRTLDSCIISYMDTPRACLRGYVQFSTSRSNHGQMLRTIRCFVLLLGPTRHLHKPSRALNSPTGGSPPLSRPPFCSAYYVQSPPSTCGICRVDKRPTRSYCPNGKQRRIGQDESTPSLVAPPRLLTFQSIVKVAVT